MICIWFCAKHFFFTLASSISEIGPIFNCQYASKCRKFANYILVVVGDYFASFFVVVRASVQFYDPIFASDVYIIRWSPSDGALRATQLHDHFFALEFIDHSTKQKKRCFVQRECIKRSFFFSQPKQTKKEQHMQPISALGEDCKSILTAPPKGQMHLAQTTTEKKATEKKSASQMEIMQYFCSIQ